MYNRGGKVWVGENGSGLVFLEKDWDHSRLPQDLVEEAGLLGTDFELLGFKERAKLGGYACKENTIVFCADIPNRKQTKGSFHVFLAWDGNNWLSSDEVFREWELSEAEQGGYFLELDFLAISKFQEFSFKFKTLDGQWIDPPDFIPCQSEPIPGVRNFIYNKNRRGRDIIRFRVIDEKSPKSIDKWISSKPHNLGLTLDGKQWVFRLFAPRAKKVDLLRYKESEFNSPKLTPMQLMKDGVWECKENLEGFENAYNFKVTHAVSNNESTEYTKIVLDPYAKGCINREGPGLLINPTNRKTNKNIFNPPDIKDLVIVEAHIRDILANAPADISTQERKGFTGLTKWLKSEDCYLRKMGANAVELQPVQQFDSRNKDEYHWGYMPVNYFCPSSDYATDFRKSIQEFKDLVEAFHIAGIAVILDVVYNHVGIPNHLLNIDRELYLLTDELGRLTNHSGCGNDLRCSAEPVKKLIIDSLKYWIETFDVDGFRFDLGELLGIELLKEIEYEIRKIKPGTILIVEPWSFRGRLPDTINRTGYSLWSDRSRENLLSFVQNHENKENIKKMLKGRLDHENQYPWQSINYCESHDDYAFIDRICLENDEGGMNPDKVAVEKAKLALVILLLSPGVPMISAGQDFLRSKRGIRNTYKHGEVNALDYERLNTFKDFSLEIREIINFRLSERGEFTRPSDHANCKYTDFDSGNHDALSVIISPKSSKEEFLFVCNPKPDVIEIDLTNGWTESEVVLPKNCEIKNKFLLQHSEYRLLAKNLK